MTSTRDAKTAAPASWEFAKLAEVATLVAGQSPPSHTYNDQGEGLPFFQGKAEFGDLYPKARKWCSASTKIAEAGDILMSVRAPVGPTNITSERCGIGRGLAAIRAHPGVEQRWLLYWLRFAEQQIAAKGTGTTFAAITASVLAREVLPIAPSDEQRRIVARIEELFGEIEAGEQELEKAREELAAYRRAVLKAAVTGELSREWRQKHVSNETSAELLTRILAEHRGTWERTEFTRLVAKECAPKGAVWKARYKMPAGAPDVTRLPELPPSWTWCSVEQAGEVLLGRQRAPQHHQGKHMRPYLRVANVLENMLDLSDVKRMNFTPREFETFRLEAGDILLNEGQSPDLVGRPAMYHGEIEDCCFQKTLLRFRARTGVVPEYALLVFRHYMHSGRFRQVARITTNIGHLTLVRFVPMEFPLPPTREQAEIAKRAKELEQLISHQELIATGAQSDMLRKSILAAAFSGKLVPQSLSDEPASALLARLRAATAGNAPRGNQRAEREKASPMKGRRRRVEAVLRERLL